MIEKKDFDYFNYGKIENEKFWRRIGHKPDLQNKTVLDFGCGHGALCINLAESGATKIKGIDLNEKLLKFANENLQQNYKEYQSKVDFQKQDLLDENFNEKFDLIVTKDTFEHSLNLPEILNKFYKILAKGGKVYAGFGPLYNSYNGDHGRTQLKLPWLHVVLSDKFIIKRYNSNNDIKINRIEDLGLSKYSLKDYKRIFKNSQFEIEFFITNQSDHPISIIFDQFRKIGFLKEFFTYNIYCILKKN